MTLPADKEIFEGELSFFWFDNGILYALGKHVTSTLEMQKQNYAFIREITNNTKVCLLLDVTVAGRMDEETRDYSSAEMPNLFLAVALLADSDRSQMNPVSLSF